MIEWLIAQATSGAGAGVIPQGVIDALIGLCALGVSSLFGFTYAIQRRLTKMETQMDNSSKDREHLWVEVMGVKSGCNNHLTKNTELAEALKYVVKVMEELKMDIKELKREFHK